MKGNDGFVNENVCMRREGALRDPTEGSSLAVHSKRNPSSLVCSEDTGGEIPKQTTLLLQEITNVHYTIYIS